MLNGKIKNLHNNNRKMFATIEYDNGNKLVFYDGISDSSLEGNFAVGERVHFEEKLTDFGIKATNLFKITEEV